MLVPAAVPLQVCRVEESTVADCRFATRVSGSRSPERDPPRARDSSMAVAIEGPVLTTPLRRRRQQADAVTGISMWWCRASTGWKSAGVCRPQATKCRCSWSLLWMPWPTASPASMQARTTTSSSRSRSRSYVRECARSCGEPAWGTAASRLSSRTWLSTRAGTRYFVASVAWS